MNVLEVNNLCKDYGSFALEDVSMSIEEGTITGFIGRNGAGKTTTLKSILGFVHPDKGDINFWGRNYSQNERAIKSRIGYVSGGFDYYPNKKLKTISAVTAKFHDNWDEKLYSKYMKRFNLDESKTPAKLSEGMKVKYSITLALSHHAELLILDEPTSGLDPVSREELLDIFMHLQEQGTTILFSTHITSDLDKCADRIVYIRGGRIIDDRDILEFKSRYMSVTMTPEEYSNCNQQCLIGLHHQKNGYSAIIDAKDSGLMQGMAKPADLETIMLHLERSSESWEI